MTKSKLKNISLSQIFGKLSNKRADSNAVLHSDPVKSLEMFALELLWCEAWESDCINSSDEPLRFPGINAGNPLFTENERDTLESVIQREEMWKDMLHLKRGKQLRPVYSFKDDIWN